MSLEEILIPYLRIPEELKNIMSKVTELQDAVNEMKQTLADEASEMFDKIDELQNQINNRVDPAELDPIIGEIRSSIINIEAMSEGRPATTPPVDEEASGEDTTVEEPVDTGEVAPVEDGAEEVPAEDTGAEPVEEAPAEDTGFEEPVDTGEVFPTEEAPVDTSGETAEGEMPIVDETVVADDSAVVSEGGSESEEDSTF